MQPFRDSARTGEDAQTVNARSVTAILIFIVRNPRCMVSTFFVFGWIPYWVKAEDDVYPDLCSVTVAAK